MKEGVSYEEVLLLGGGGRDQMEALVAVVTRMFVKYWIYVCGTMFFFVSFEGKIVLYKVIYMVMFLCCVALYQVLLPVRLLSQVLLQVLLQYEAVGAATVPGTSTGIITIRSCRCCYCPRYFYRYYYNAKL